MFPFGFDGFEEFEIHDDLGEDLYPIFFEGELLEEDDVDDMFACFYTSKAALLWDMSVYVGDGVRVQPDGTMMDD